MKSKAMTVLCELGIVIHELGTALSKWAIRHGAEVGYE